MPFEIKVIPEIKFTKSLTEELQKRTTINIQEKANLIWAIADKLVGTYKPHEYGNVILPMCVIKRFSDTLAPTKEAVLKANKLCDERGLAVRKAIKKYYLTMGKSLANTTRYIKDEDFAKWDDEDGEDKEFGK